MKKSLLLFVAATLVVACSTPKYTYYFDRYSVKSTSAVSNDNADEVSDVAVSRTIPPPSSLTREPIAKDAPTPVQDKTLTASSSKSISGKAYSSTPSVGKDLNPASTKFAEQKNFKKKIRGQKMASPDAVKDGDASKNGFAIAGFVSSLVGLFVFPFVFCTVGIVMSAIGMKSGRKKMAIAGLVIGIVGIVLVLVML